MGLSRASVQCAEGCCCYSLTWSGMVVNVSKHRYFWVLTFGTPLYFSFVIQKKKKTITQGSGGCCSSTASFTVIIWFFLVWITWVLWSKGTAVAFHVIACTLWANLNKFYQNELGKNHDSCMMKRLDEAENDCWFLL